MQHAQPSINRKSAWLCVNLVEVPVDRDIRPVGTGTWSLPPFPHAEPNFRKLAGLDK